MIKISIAFFFCCISAVHSFAQQKSFSKKDLAGRWQRNDSIVGSGLQQNFQFFENNKFILNIGNDADDAVSIIQLKGTFQLKGDTLLFTITSRVIVEGPLTIAEPGLSLNLFDIGGKPREVAEKHPKQLDPCFITVFTKRHIRINNERYYKVNAK